MIIKAFSSLKKKKKTPQNKTQSSKGLGIWRSFPECWAAVTWQMDGRAVFIVERLQVSGSFAFNWKSQWWPFPSSLDGRPPLADVLPCTLCPQVVDSQLVCMMNENSVDYISRFNDLAQELSIAEPSRREVLFDGSGGAPPVSDLSQ